MNKDFLKTIKPQSRGKSDKYAWFIYKYLFEQSKAGALKYYKIMWCRKTQNSVANTEFDNRKENSLTNIYLITDIDGISGVNLSNVIMGKFYEVYFDAINGEDFKDITEWFVKEYVLKGRCLFDSTHTKYFTDAEHRFSILDESNKVCNWCGCAFKKEVEYIPHEKWVINEDQRHQDGR